MTKKRTVDQKLPIQYNEIRWTDDGVIIWNYQKAKYEQLFMANISKTQLHAYIE
ncbi:unnamed protein product [Paramecium octaurelia]|uniref:Uncharacterized protein n=1 Tax=Paramecium octaurelia TaxID=43137 RepID=A0A8S1U0R4_PAROT|nr:unnamed protein product [Paramecium octaurelia]